MAAPIGKQILQNFRRKMCSLHFFTIVGTDHSSSTSYLRFFYAANSTTSPANASDNSSKYQKLIAKKTASKEIERQDANNLSELVLREMNIETNTEDTTEINLKDLRPSLKAGGNIAAYIRHSDALAKLVDLGVDLSQIENNADATNMFVKFDFEKNVKPYLLFLNQLKVPNNLLAQCIMRNPMIFAESLDDLQLCIDYLKSKNFDEDGIVSLVTRATEFLSLSTKDLDGRLGYLQKKFGLQGKEVRQAVVKQPKLLRVSSEFIRWHCEAVDFIGFSKEDAKDMFIAFPKMYLIGTPALITRHEYIHNVMLIPLEVITKWPQIYHTRESRLEQRHTFLKSRNRAQYDPTKENYVSLYKLATTNDSVFATEIAMSTVLDYNEFLKTI